MSLKSKSLSIFLLILTAVIFLWRINLFKSSYLTKYSPEAAQSRYEQSQYSPNMSDQNIVIDDDELYALAGYNYLKTGDLVKINFETPPLGKIFIGLSIRFFGNPNVFQILWASLLLLILYKLSLLVLKDAALSFIPGLITLFDPIFLGQLKRSFLDLPHTVFILLVLYLAMQPRLSRSKFLLLGASLGAVAAFKFFLTALILGIFVCAIMFYKHKVSILNLVTSLFSASAVYFISYAGYFFSGYGLWDFAKFHFYVLRFYRSYIPEYPPFEIWRIILTGSWRTWFGNQLYVSVSDWWIGWPLGVGSAIAIFLKKLPLESKIPAIWLVLYLVANSFHVVFPRYLLVILPIGYLYFVYWMKPALARFVK